LNPLVESEFPGLEVEGSFSELKMLAADLASLLSGVDAWRGTGITVCREGVLYGPGGPDWMMKVFPGLKLVEYRWREMNNHFEILEDGSKKNNVLFNGELYNIYLEGVTNPLGGQEKYAEAIWALHTDLQESRAALAAPEGGVLRTSAAKARRMRLQNAGLEGLWRDYQAGAALRIYEANYVVGGILGMRSGKVFEKPRELLRVPIFNSLSFISGQTMFGMETALRARR